MIGAASIGAFYHGFEPATQTYRGLLELGEFLQSFGTGFTYEIENCPIEDAAINGHYDVALTSPPYYDTELYSTEPTQSYIRYRSFGDWCAGFYIPMAQIGADHADTFVINVGTRQYPMTDVLRQAGLVVTRTHERLSGKAGLGRQPDGAEAFFVVSR